MLKRFWWGLKWILFGIRTEVCDLTGEHKCQYPYCEICPKWEEV